MKLTEVPTYIGTFLKEARQEFRHVNWPTRQEALYLTAIVIGLALGLAFFLGFFDYLFSFIVQKLISR